MRDRDGPDTARVRNSLDRFGVDQGEAVPKDVAAGSAHQERALPDAEPWVRYDAREPWLFLPETVAMRGAQIIKRSPFLAL